MFKSPVEQNSTVTDALRLLPTPFLVKTYDLVDDHEIDDVISWNEDGSGFVVWKPSEFATDLLPKNFKHNNFSSFIRQLNTYGFRKAIPDRWEFVHDRFRRGEKRLLRDIHRRKISTPASSVPAMQAVPLIHVSPASSAEEQVISSGSSATGSGVIGAEIAEENERLRKENMQLKRELMELKNLCNNIHVLMSNFAANRSESVKPVEVRPAKRFAGEPEGRKPEGDIRTRLFGVALGVRGGGESKGDGGEA